MAEPTTPKPFETIKAVFDVAKQTVLGLIFLTVVFYPAVIGHWIVGTGVTKGKLFGFEWETQLQKTNEGLQQSVDDRVQLLDRLTLANEAFDKQKQLLETIQNTQGSANPQIAKAVDAARRLISDNESVIQTAKASTQAAQQTIAANANLVPSAPGGGATPSSRWALLVGSDPTKEAAQDEIRGAAAAGFQNVKLIHNRGVYRTAILFPDRQAAFDALPNAKKLRPDAYVVSMDKWCPNPSEKDGQIECGK